MFGPFSRTRLIYTRINGMRSLLRYFQTILHIIMISLFCKIVLNVSRCVSMSFCVCRRDTSFATIREAIIIFYFVRIGLKKKKHFGIHYYVVVVYCLRITMCNSSNMTHGITSISLDSTVHYDL